MSTNIINEINDNNEESKIKRTRNRLTKKQQFIKEREEISQLNCQHKFCTNCITEHIHRNRSETRCPFCRENITHITFQNDINEEHF